MLPCQLGFQDQVLPYSLVCFLAASMSHADLAIVQARPSPGINHAFPWLDG